MSAYLNNKIRKYLEQHNKQKIWLFTVIVMAVIVVALVSAMLLKSGISMSNNSSDPNICELEIAYYLEDTEIQIAPVYRASLLKGSTYSVPSPEIDGFVLKNSSNAEIAGTLSSNLETKVYYKYSAEQAKYTVNYWGYGIEGGAEELLKSVNGTGSVDSLITVRDEIFDGYRRETTDLSLQITADGNAVKNVYYIKSENPCIIFNTDTSYVPIISAKPGTNISDRIAALKIPSKPGYEFDKWNQEIPSIMPDSDLIVNAVWKPGESNYTVQFWFQDAVGDGYTRNKGLDETRTAITESVVAGLQEDIDKADESLYSGADYDEYKKSPFFGFDYVRCEKVRVTADGKSILKLYYDREIWTVNFYNNPTTEELTKSQFLAFDLDLWQTFSGRYGAPVPVNYPTPEQSGEHYRALNIAPEGNPYYVNIASFDESIFRSDGGYSTTNFYSLREFSLEDGTRTHKVDLFPFFDSRVNLFQIHLFGQKLGADANDHENGYELISSRFANASKSRVNLNVNPPTGFTCDGSAFRTCRTEEPGHWVNPATWQEIPGWRSLNPYIRSDGSAKFEIATYTEIHFARVKNPISFISNGETVRTENDIYYESPLLEYLQYVPENSNPDVIFDGWFFTPECKEDDRVPDNYIMPETGLSLYAKWVGKPCTITFDSRGGSAVEPQQVHKNDLATPPENPTKKNSVFLGWFTKSGEQWNFETQVTEDITLYARWWTTLDAIYTVKHVLKAPDGTETTITEIRGSGFSGDSVVVSALTYRDPEYVKNSYVVPDAHTKTIELKPGDKNTAIFYYQVPDLKDYTVSYYFKNSEVSVIPDKIVKASSYSVVTEKAENISDYTLIEGTPEYQMVGEYGYSTTLLVVNGDNHIIFYYEKNELQNVDICIQKTDTNQTVTLPGVEFELYTANVSDKGEWSKVDEKTPLLSFTTDDDGKYKIEKLVPGNYLLYETKAAAGYELPKEPWRITVKNDTSVLFTDSRGNGIDVSNSEGSDIYHIINSKAYELPKTGGIGAEIIYTTAVLMIFMSAGGIYIKKRRKIVK